MSKKDSLDIARVLIDWPFKSGAGAARLIEGDDGQEKVQMRLELGLMQMELDGRPDGQKIEGVESWLHHLEAVQQKHDEDNPDGMPFQLEPEDCQKLLQEGVQYYHRYISFWQLRRYELCARDTQRNLRLFAFVRKHARRDRDKLEFDQWRPYVTMMHTRAVATPLIDLDDVSASLGAIHAGIAGIERFLKDYGQQERASDCNELVYLQKWRDELSSEEGDKIKRITDDSLPESPLDLLKDQLEQAVTEERYEDAAKLRDQIARQDDPPPHQ